MPETFIPFNIDGPQPEPEIGPGMILERGRRRVDILDFPSRAYFYKVRVWKRRWFTPEWTTDSFCWELWAESDIRRLLNKGYTIIRPADKKETTQGKGTA